MKKKTYILKKETIISDILRDCPQVAGYLIEYGLFCVNCPLNQFETLEAGAKVHNINDKDLEDMINQINKKLK